VSGLVTQFENNPLLKVNGIMYIRCCSVYFISASWLDQNCSSF